MLVRMENKEKQGLGLPLPSGGIALFETVSGADVLVGQDNLRDHAIGEEVEAQLGGSAQLQYRLERLREEGAKQVRYRLEITNAHERPAPPAIRLQQSDGFQYAQTRAPLGRQYCVRTWPVTGPLNASVQKDQ